MLYSVNNADIIPTLSKIRQDSHVFIVELNGADIKTWGDYILEIEKKFHFPSTCIDSIDRYLDWIRDLSWINKDEFAIIIYNYDSFLSSDLRIKGVIIDSFCEIVLPWWGKEVEDCVVDGKAKPFNIYLVS